MNNSLKIAWVSKTSWKKSLHLVNIECRSSPLNSLWERSKYSKFDKFAMVCGIEPERSKLKDKIAPNGIVTNNYSYYFYYDHACAYYLYSQGEHSNIESDFCLLRIDTKIHGLGEYKSDRHEIFENPNLEIKKNYN